MFFCFVFVFFWSNQTKTKPNKDKIGAELTKSFGLDDEIDENGDLILPRAAEISYSTPLLGEPDDELPLQPQLNEFVSL